MDFFRKGSSFFKSVLEFVSAPFNFKTSKKKDYQPNLITIATPSEISAELKLRTEEFGLMSLTQSIKDLEKAFYHLSASVNTQARKADERMVALTTINEELLHNMEQLYQVEDPYEDSSSSSATSSSEDMVAFKKMLESKKRTVLN
jgi:hypothetical protein